MNSPSTLSDWERSMIIVYFSRKPVFPATFESLNHDTLSTVLEFVGSKSYRSFGGINKHCREIYITSGMKKETFLFGYAPLEFIMLRYERAIEDNDEYEYDLELDRRVGKGVVLYDRKDVLDWALQEQNIYLLRQICSVAAREGRIYLLDEVWNNINDDVFKRHIVGSLHDSAARFGKLNVLKWLETKRLPINNSGCANRAAWGGQLHILQWLQEEKGFFDFGDCVYEADSGGQLHILKWLKEEKGFGLDGGLYVCAINGDHLHVMKWLREQGCPWGKSTFHNAAWSGNLDILQWLHDEGCPWPDDLKYRIYEDRLKPEVIDWLRVNGYSDRIREEN